MKRIRLEIVLPILAVVALLGAFLVRVWTPRDPERLGRIGPIRAAAPHESTEGPGETAGLLHDPHVADGPISHKVPPHRPFDEERVGLGELRPPSEVPGFKWPLKLTERGYALEWAGRQLDFTKGGVELTVGGSSITLAPASASRSGLVLDEARQVDPTANEGVIEYRRAKLIEAYELRGYGVEQKFVFPEPFGGVGDLQITVPVETRLQGRRAALDGGASGSASIIRKSSEIEYVDGMGNPVFYIGRAWAIDAAGEMVRAPLHLTQAGYEIQVPQEFLAAAKFPLMVDPPVLLVDSTRGHGFSSVAYNSSTGLTGSDTYMVTIQFKNPDWDVEWAKLNTDGTFGGPIVTSAASTGSTHDTWPDIAYSKISNRYLIVWTDEATAGTFVYKKVEYALVNANGAVISSGTLHTSATEVGIGAKVAWDSANNRFLVVWLDKDANSQTKATFGGKYVIVDANAAVVLGPTTFIVNSDAANADSVDVDFNENKALHMLVYSRSLAGEQAAFVNTIKPAGGIGTWLKVSTADFDEPDPRVAIAANDTTGDWLAVWSDARVGASGGEAIRAALVSADASNNALLQKSDFIVGDTTRIDYQPRCDWSSVLNQY